MGTLAAIHLLGVEEVSMMLSTPQVKVIHVTTHIGLIEDFAFASPEPNGITRA